MPSHNVASSFAKLYALDGAPWNWPAWQDRTGIRHGLFPTDDKHLPPGWTRKDAVDVHSYFLAYNALPSEARKLQFAAQTKGTSSHPGRKVWANFVTRHWPRWGLHDVIVSELKDADVHPVMILVRENALGGEWPNADFYVPKILDSLGLKLFGDDAFPDGVEVLRTDLRKCLQMFVQRAWNTIRNHVAPMRTRPKQIEATAIASFDDLEAEGLTKAKVASAIRAVAKWRECAEMFKTPDNVRKADDMLAKLQVVMEGLGAKIPKNRRVQAKGTCKVSAQALANLATEEDVSDLLHVYHEYFETNFEDEDAIILPDNVPDGERPNTDEGDFGMEVEANMNPASLAYQLGFPTRLPAQFSTFRHRSGITPWDDPTIFKDPQNEGLEQLALHWHQYAGVHSMIRSLFTSEKDATHPAGVLVGDEVGLGKTAQAITLIAFLNQCILGHDRHIPPVLENRRFLCGTNKIPSFPHLILCPGTLVAQWVHELKVFFIPKSVDILVYDSHTDAKFFWGPFGPLRRSKQDSHNIIIVASHSALFNDFRKTHRKLQQKGARPWDIPEAKHTLTGTIFGASFLSIVIDEAHNLRNVGNKHAAALRLLQQARIKIIMTATPLHTAPKDVSSLARLIGIAHFFDEVSFIEEKDDASNLRKAKKSEELAERLQIVRRIQTHFQGHFLRRTTASRDWQGKELLDLPPYKEIIGVVNLTEREKSIIEARAESAKAAVLSSSDSRIHTKKFYLEYRLAVGYAKEDPASPWPTFNSLEDWVPAMSTKMDVCAKICRHYLMRDDAEDVQFENGLPIFPESPEVPEGGIKRDRRILIFAEFSSMTPLLRNVLQLYGIPSLTIHGKVPFDQRDRRIKDLYSDKNPARVFVFSSVGSVGLNLSIADVVIFFDQPWSAQDEQQIRGRAHRQPQKKTVKVIHLLASDSADLLMNDVARGKRNMFDAFVNKELGEELRQLLQGAVPDAPVDQEDEPVKAAAPSKRKKRSRTKKLVDDQDDSATVPTPDPAIPGINENEGETSDSFLSNHSISEPEVIQEREPGREKGKPTTPSPTQISERVLADATMDNKACLSLGPMDTDTETLPLGGFGDMIIDNRANDGMDFSHTDCQRPTEAIVPASNPPGTNGDSPPPKRPRLESLNTPAQQKQEMAVDGRADVSGTARRPSPFSRPTPTLPPVTSPNPLQGLRGRNSFAPATVSSESRPAIPRRTPGPLNDVSVPPKSALNGDRRRG